MATRSALAAVLLSVGATAAIAVRAAARRHANLPETVAAAIDALIAEHWEWRMKANPELAAFFGEAPPKGASVLDDRSLRAYAALEAHAKHMLDRLAAVPDVKLPAKVALRRRLFQEQLEGLQRGLRHRAFLMPVSNLEGPQVDFAAVIGWFTAGEHPDLNHVIAAYEALPQQMEQVIELMQQGIKEGRVSAVESLRRVPQQIMAIIKDPSEFLQPFKDCDEALKRRALEAIELCIVNSFSRLLNYMHATYIPAAEARGSSACRDFPDGEEMYQECLRFHTSTEMTADEVHATGLAEVKRIKDAMKGVMKQCGFSGTLREFADSLRQDKQHVCSTQAELLAGYQKIMDHVQSKLPSLFYNIPSTPCTLKAMSPEKAKSAPAAYYYAGTPDGKRPGVFYANTDNLPARKIYEMEALTLHEAIPGHHFQIQLAIENGGLAVFQAHLEDRRYGEAPGRFPLYSAYVEGWGLYSEALGHEIDGVYDSPYSHFGQLSMEMLRACRLVVDTGLHHLRWDAEKAIKYCMENTMMAEGAVRNEIYRYITWPGQATGYKIGQMKISQLRAKAEAALGGKFDLRKFHDVVVGMGPVPLGLLEEEVDAWVASVLSS